MEVVIPQGVAVAGLVVVCIIALIWNHFGIVRSIEWKQQYLEDQRKEIERGLREEGYIK